MPELISNSEPSRYQRAGEAALFLAAMAVCAIYGFGQMMTTMRFYDDEGSMLIAIKYFNDGHALYDEAYSMYGPFSFLIKRLICAY